MTATEFSADVVLHRAGAENRYLPVTRKARRVFLVLPNTLGVPCEGARWEDADRLNANPPTVPTLVALAACEAKVAERLGDFSLSVAEAIA